MCGICGLVSMNSAPVDPGVLNEMNQTLFHCGPDSGGTFVDGGRNRCAAAPKTTLQSADTAVNTTARLALDTATLVP